MEPSMKKIVQYIGIDVDDKAYHVCVYNPLNDQVKQFKCGPSTDLLIRGLKRHNLSPEEVTICYEASYIGYSIQNVFFNKGAKQKTDKIDAKKMMQFETGPLSLSKQKSKKIIHM